MTDLLHKYLYHSGSASGVLTEDEHNKAVAMCDGYGEKSVAELKDLDLTWDWSHVRDSSDEALAKAEAYVGSLVTTGLWSGLHDVRGS